MSERSAARNRNPPAHRHWRGRCRSLSTWRSACSTASTATTPRVIRSARAEISSTAPEVSQMFGELIGLWAATVWTQMGAPENVRLIELGPGRGTLMNDALRAVQIVPEFHSAIVAHLVEISPVLAEHSRKKHWKARVCRFSGTRSSPTCLQDRRLFLPMSSLTRCRSIRPSRPTAVGTSAGFRSMPTISLLLRSLLNRFRFSKPCCRHSCSSPRAGAIFEWRGDTEAMEVGRRVADGRGRRPGDRLRPHRNPRIGETFQAVGQHAYADPLDRRPARSTSLPTSISSPCRGPSRPWARKGFGPIEQSQFLRRLGIEQRAASLKAKAARADDIDQALGAPDRPRTHCHGRIV